ncbi:hypothetical protein JTB14_005996 [Gonioctena quinquepunctata]|nr:hypothetical protein JTB14_005996 [Gonioctena quinquepunctata]
MSTNIWIITLRLCVFGTDIFHSTRSSFKGKFAGACMTYGHACWGGHGKRSDTSKSLQGTELGKALKSRWFLSKLIQSPKDLRFLHGIDFDIPGKQSSDSIFSSDDFDSMSGQEEWRNDREMSDDQLFDDNLIHAKDSNRMSSTTFLDKRSVERN